MINVEMQIIDHKTGNLLYVFSSNLLTDMIFSRKLNDIGSLSFGLFAQHRVACRFFYL